MQTLPRTSEVPSATFSTLTEEEFVAETGSCYMFLTIIASLDEKFVAKVSLLLHVLSFLELYQRKNLQQFNLNCYISQAYIPQIMQQNAPICYIFLFFCYIFFLQSYIFYTYAIRLLHFLDLQIQNMQQFSPFSFLFCYILCILYSLSIQQTIEYAFNCYFCYKIQSICYILCIQKLNCYIFQGYSPIFCSRQKSLVHIY